MNLLFAVRCIATATMLALLFAGSVMAGGHAARDPGADSAQRNQSDLEFIRERARDNAGEERKKKPQRPPKQKESGEKGGTEDMNIGIGEL